MFKWSQMLDVCARARMYSCVYILIYLFESMSTCECVYICRNHLAKEKNCWRVRVHFCRSRKCELLTYFWLVSISLCLWYLLLLLLSLAEMFVFILLFNFGQHFILSNGDLVVVCSWPCSSGILFARCVSERS